LQIYVRKFVPVFNNEQRIPVLVLWFDSQFKEQFQLRMPDSSQIRNMTGEHVHQADPSECDHVYPFALHFVSTDAWKKPRSERHPFNVLHKLMGDKLFDKLPAEMTDLICHEVLMQHNESAEDIQARNKLGETVRDLTGGWVDVQYTLQPGDKKELLRCGDRGWLHRLTCVYPWAIDVLLRRPNCLMTDSTFKVLGPYTLPILHAIFANESIPIAFGISPTETAGSYENMYAAIEGIFDHVVHQGVSIIHLPDQCRKRDTGDVAWPEAIKPDADEALTGEIVPPEWRKVVGVIDDAVKVQRPPEQNAREFLRSIPIITDQGTALQAFVNGRQLDWKICHRHIIEAIGARSLLGQWATRLLNTYRPEEWERTVALVMDEMILQSGQYSTDCAGYRSLLRLMGIVENGDDHCLAPRARWALWERKGCPRTTNSAESVNGHLNQNIKLTQPLTKRIRCVARHFMDRYSSRNTWCDRAFTRNAHNCFPSDAMKARPWYSEARVEFYKALHNASSLDEPVRRKFAPETPAYIFPRFSQSRWLAESPQADLEPEDVEGSPDASDRSSIPLHQTACETWRAHVAWQIAHEISNHLGSKVWRQCSTQIVENIISIGISLGMPENEPFSIKQEAAWRAKCWVAAGKSRCSMQVSDPLEAVHDAIPEPLPGQILSARARFREFLDRQRRLPPAEPAVKSRALAPPSKSAHRAARQHSSRAKACPSKGVRPLGLRNEARTCYLNAVVQTLVHLPALSPYFDQGDVQKRLRESTDCPVAAAYCRLQRLFTERSPDHVEASEAAGQPSEATVVDSSQPLVEPPHTVADPSQAVVAPSRKSVDRSPKFLDPLFLRAVMDPMLTRWNPEDQHDASEFLQVLLETLDNELRHLPPVQSSPDPHTSDMEHNTIVSHLFTGNMEHRTTCRTCHTELTRSEPFWILPLQLIGPDGRPAPRFGSIQLATCFKWLMAEHRPDPNNLPFCDICKIHVDASQVCGLLDLPRVLVLHFGRFTGSEKNQTPVTFPPRLDVSGYLRAEKAQKDCQYTLASVIEHKGDTFKHGHFISYFRKGPIWFSADDRVVTQKDWTKVANVQAYLLFYEHVLLTE
jgi:ubiquitin C-terminal hydrolase